jgi:DNA repair protein RecO (recombination protein O)
MLRLNGEPAFVLHRRQFSETSLLLDVLTLQHGRLGMLARGARSARSSLSALLQPFQALRVSAAGGGELLRLSGADATEPPFALLGERALAGLYANELLVRLWPRGESQPNLYERYVELLRSLAGPAPLAWQLRCFERDLLDSLGYGYDYTSDADGRGLDPGGRYQYAPDSGFIGVSDRQAGYSGAAILALAATAPPDATLMREQRRLLRALIAAQLNGPPLRSWGMLSELGQL